MTSAPDQPARDRLMDAARHGDLPAVQAALRDRKALLREKDENGATALHYAAFGGHLTVAEFLVQQGADVNARDDQYGATPAGWAIEYLREMGGLLGIEFEDFAFAITQGDVIWVERFLRRFPRLRECRTRDGQPFRALAEETGNTAIVNLFKQPDTAA